MLYKTALTHGIILTRQELDLFNIYLDELNNWNRKINLTGLSSNNRIISELLLDSIIPAPHIPDTNKMLDVGSGAGLPAIPLKIIRPRFRIRLVESNSKRVSFLKHVIRILKLDDIYVYKGRIEHPIEGISHKGFGLITARAFASLDQTISLCSPFLSPNGFLICFLGANADEIIEKNHMIFEKHSLSIFKKISYTLPGKLKKRHDIIFKKDLL